MWGYLGISEELMVVVNWWSSPQNAEEKNSLKQNLSHYLLFLRTDNSEKRSEKARNKSKIHGSEQEVEGRAIKHIDCSSVWLTSVPGETLKQVAKWWICKSSNLVLFVCFVLQRANVWGVRRAQCMQWASTSDELSQGCAWHSCNWGGRCDGPSLTPDLPLGWGWLRTDPMPFPAHPSEAQYLGEG